MTKNVKERRSTRRFLRNLDFRVKIGAQTFTCETHDISTQGLSLRNPLPQWVPKNFRAKLSFAKADVRVVCCRISETKLQILDADHWDVIRKWIVMW